MKRFDLRDLVEQSVVANAPYAARLGVRLACEAEVDRAPVLGDAARIEQVLANIMSNAAKFSPEGSLVRVHLGVEAGRARVSVIDEGPGLADQDRERVFDKFSQVDSSDTRKIGGTGLGMNISKQIMQAHKGAIDYRKNPDAGTTFYFELDLEEDDSHVALPEASADAGAAAAFGRKCIAAG